RRTTRRRSDGGGGSGRPTRKARPSPRVGLPLSRRSGILSSGATHTRPEAAVPDEVLKRFGTDAEPAEKLAGDAARAEAVLGVHGVSVTARETTAPAGHAVRADVEAHFPVHDTPSRRDKLHRTV